MEKSSCDGTIRVKSKFADHLKYLSNVDSVLSAAKLHQVEGAGEEELYVNFCIQFENGTLSKESVSDIQVRLLFVW